MKGRVKRIAAEFAVIFAGVTLGLLADDWRQANQTRGAELDALSDLVADLHQDSILLDSLALRLTGWSDASLLVNQSADDTSPEEIYARIRPLLRSREYNPFSPTYLGLSSTGGVGLLADREVRRRVIEYYEVQQAWMKTRSDYVGEMRLPLSTSSLSILRQIWKVWSPIRPHRACIL